MKRKALFFDVDGTLLSEINRTVPESAVRAILEARKQGHVVFINSGRVYCLLDFLNDFIDVDGYLCGCGTRILVQGKTEYAYQMPHERGIHLKKDIVYYGLDGWLEGNESVCFQNHVSKFPKVEQVKRTLIEENGCIFPGGWEEDNYEFDKFCVIAGPGSDREGFFQTIPDFDIIDRGDDFYECVPIGHSKATAIQWVLEHYGIALEEAYVFGDSTNDLPMFQYAPNGIVMGNHAKELEPFASFITKTVEEDGIVYAMESLGII
ncbi:HAD family hydrolase [Lachnospiraceae bacterium 62-35]